MLAQPWTASNMSMYHADPCTKKTCFSAQLDQQAPRASVKPMCKGLSGKTLAVKQLWPHINCTHSDRLVNLPSALVLSDLNVKCSTALQRHAMKRRANLQQSRLPFHQDQLAAKYKWLILLHNVQPLACACTQLSWFGRCHCALSLYKYNRKEMSR